MRERRSMTALPPIYYLHVWWARRPLVAARAAILASLLPADADHEKFNHVLGIHGDPIAAKKRIAEANRKGERLGPEPYGYARAFQYTPSPNDLEWFRKERRKLGGGEAKVLDPTAGGGSIPFEAERLSLGVVANDLNPVAGLLLKATLDAPFRFGAEVLSEFRRIAKKFVETAEPRFKGVFRQEPKGTVVLGYLWARTIHCPYCEGLIPLSPNWRLSSSGTGIRLVPHMKPGKRVCSYEIVESVSEQSLGTVSGGDATCPFPDCQRVVDGDDIKRQAQSGQMGEQLYAVAYKQQIAKASKTGRQRESWERLYRAPQPEDDLDDSIQKILHDKLPQWEACDILPSEAIPEESNYDRGHRMYGMYRWRDFFNPRQLLCHGISVEVFREILEAEHKSGHLSDVTRAGFVYFALAIDKLLNYGTRSCRWDATTGRIRSLFDQHNFTMVWSYAEMAPVVAGEGYDWAIEQTAKCIEELIKLTTPSRDTASKKRSKRFDVPTLPGILAVSEPAPEPVTSPPLTLTCKSADQLDNIGDGSIDCVVMDPPYYDNVMYAELSDFFYVWLKRTAGYVYPELFRLKLTNKESEAVANAALFHGQKGARELAARDYRDKMASIFTECRRVLKSDGILTLMFTHKATGAWDALASGLMEAGFTITASWPINTESEGSLHIKDKAAANSTIFLVCRPRLPRDKEDMVYWEDVEPRVATAVRCRIEDFEKAGIKGVDLYLSCFGPALEEFAKHWPLKRGQPRAAASNTGRRKQPDDGATADPYSVTPEDALDAARHEVKKWKLDRLLRTHRKSELDPLTEWFVLAWEAFKAPEFPYDEGLRLARVVGIDLDHDVLGKVAEKKGSDLILWDSSRRAAKGALGPTDGSRSLLDALHHAAHRGRTQGVEAAREVLMKSGADHRPGFPAALAAVLEVLPVSRSFSPLAEESGSVAEAASDFEALEHLRRLAFSEKVALPQRFEQLELWSDATQ